MIFIIFILKQFTDPSWWAVGPWIPANLLIEVNSLIHRHQNLSRPRHITGKNLQDLRLSIKWGRGPKFVTLFTRCKEVFDCAPSQLMKLSF